MWFEIYMDHCPLTKEPWRWKLRNGEDQVIAISVNGYSDADACHRAITDLKKISLLTKIKLRTVERDTAFVTLSNKRR